MTKEQLAKFFEDELTECVRTIRGMRNGQYSFIPSETDARHSTLTRCHGAFDFCQRNGLKYEEIAPMYERIYKILYFGTDFENYLATLDKEN